MNVKALPGKPIDTESALPKLPPRSERLAEGEKNPGKSAGAADVEMAIKDGSNLGFGVAREASKVDIEA